jgi:hypothetical protein
VIHRHHLTAVALAAALLLGAAGCSSSDDDTSGSDGPTTTVSAGAEDDGGARGAADAAEDDEPREGDASAVTLVDGPADAENTVTFTADGAFDPGAIEISADEVITFEAAPDAGTSAVTFNGSDTYTLSGGLTESFTISAPGTYTATEFLSGAQMTITVTG